MVGWMMAKEKLLICRGQCCDAEQLFGCCAGKYFSVVERCSCILNKFVDKSVCRLKKLPVNMETSLQPPCLGPASFTFSLQKRGPNHRYQGEGAGWKPCVVSPGHARPTASLAVGGVVRR